MVRFVFLLKFSLLLTVLTVRQSFALPGDPQSEGPINSGCGFRVESPLAEAIRTMGGALQCQGFTQDQAKEMCDCMAGTYGDAIEKDEDYKAFKKNLMAFDISETAMVEFNQDVASIEMALLVNFIAGQDPSIGEPFQPGGACESKFTAYQNQINGESGLTFDFSPIIGWMGGHNRPDYLQSQGVDAQSLESTLESFWRTGRSENGNFITSRGEDEQSNRLFRYLYNSSHSKFTDQSTFERLSSNLPQSGDLPEFMGLSKTDAVDALCNGLLARFREMREENDAFKPNETLLDRENLLTDRNLYSTDVKSFRGLRSRYLSSNEESSYRDELFFNQRFCESYSHEESMGNVERSTDPDILNATDMELKEIIIVRNGFFESISEQLEAGQLQMNELIEMRDRSRDNLAAALEAAGFDWDDFKNHFLYLEAEDDPIAKFNELFANIRPEGPAPENLQDILAFVQQYHIDNQELSAAAETWGTLYESYYTGQQEHNEAVKELLHRKGSMAALKEFLEEENVISRTGQFYAAYDQDISTDYIGPKLPVHAHMTDGSGGVVTTIWSRITEVATRDAHAAVVANQLVEEGKSDSTLMGDFRERARDALLKGFFSSRRSGSSNLVRRTNSSGRKDQSNYANVLSNGLSPVKMSPRSLGQFESSSRLETNKRTVGSPANVQGKNENVLGVGLNNQGDLLNPGASNGNRVAASTSQFYSPQNINRITREKEEGQTPGPAVNSAISSLERRLEELGRRQSSLTSERRPNSEDSDDNSALISEVSRLKGELESLREASANLKARESRGESPAATSVVNDTIPEVTNNNSFIPDVQGFSGRSGGTSAVNQAKASPTPSVGGDGAGISAGFASSGPIEVPFRAPSSLTSVSDSVRSEGDSPLSSYNGVSLRLVSGSLGFAEVDAQNLAVQPVEIAIDFLSLSDSAKAQFIESFFRERSGESAVLRQIDGRVVLIEKNDRYKAVLASPDSELTSEEVSRGQADIVHRVRTMNNTLDNFLLNLQ